ncbi:MAG: helix-turn-helix domain-containing protein [Alphaproteobacteria bacterium]|nr:helix-turn-helix domain-containing protein [Alphaproteobacteria bacterium]
MCAEFGISRKTAYKWRQRLLDEGVAGLEDRSRRPKTQKLETSADMVASIVSLRRANPRYGPKKLRALLLREHDEADVPSVKTIDRALRRCGEPRKKRRSRKQPLQKHSPAWPSKARMICGRSTSRVGGSLRMARGCTRSP